MSRAPNIFRRAARAYIEYIDSAADKLAALLSKASSASPSSSHSPSWATSLPTSSASVDLPVRLPVCFTVTSTANSRSFVRNAWHWLGYAPQPAARRIFWVDEADDVSAWRLLDDRPFGGRSEGRLRIEHRKAADGQSLRVLVWEGTLHPLEPFAPQGSRWTEDVIRPPDARSSSSSSSLSPPPSPAGPSGLTTPPGLLNGFASLTSPTFAFPDLNLSPYSHLAFHMTTDGRPYTLSLRCKERLPLVYQARIPSHASPRPLHTKKLPFSSLLTTFQGRMRTLQLPMPKGRIASWGIGVNGPPGPFRVEVHEVWARKGMTEWEESTMSPEDRERRQRDDERAGDERFLWWLTDSERNRMMMMVAGRRVAPAPTEPPRRVTEESSKGEGSKAELIDQLKRDLAAREKPK